jgi:glycosyltransferase involved in cell wall biosynthesis
MRILVDYRPALRARTGVGQYIHALLRVYIAQGRADVMLFTSSWKDRPSPSLAGDLGARVVHRRIPVSVLNLLWHRAEWPPVDLLAPSADVVHSAHPLLMPTRRAAQVVTVHDLYFLAHPEQTSAEIRRDYPRLAGDHARRAHAIVTSTAHTKALLTSTFGVPPERIYVCSPGAPTWHTLGQSPNVPRDGYLLFLGTLEPRKNLGVLLDAYDTLLARGTRPPRLLVAGGASAAGQAWLDRMARGSLGTYVSYKGYVADSDRESLFAGARGLLLPSLDEGFGLPALEAMSAGVPAVVSNRGALPEVVGRGGFLLDPLDVDAWASAIERLGQDDAWATTLGHAGLERARAFSWLEAASTLHQAYLDAVARRGAG